MNAKVTITFEIESRDEDSAQRDAADFALQSRACHIAVNTSTLTNFEVVSVEPLLSTDVQPQVKETQVRQAPLQPSVLLQKQDELRNRMAHARLPGG
ncbi:hypothetical protein [Anatilimnocola floriformis]|uniref:hypothetical protein n=1 Tax=Anatilimnocola floriformis TaxID=2948575 RepID=UPI0020C4605B|nr:hypothetical protein [Anatilimnocola floriformis]